MGNEIEDKNLKQEELKIEIEVISKKKSNKLKIIKAVPPPTTIFYYIKPVRFNDDDLYELEENFKCQQLDKKSQIGTNNDDISTISQYKSKTKRIERILVSWNSFIKIRKKNYLDEYIHINDIGKGAFGNVSKIKMKYGGLFRAAKVIKTSMIFKQKDAQQKIFSQVQIPSRIDHPNINKLYEVFHWRNQLILVTQLCEGGDLFKRIKISQSLSELKIASMMRQILSGVVYLHKNNIVHRDLKPQNILYDNESQHLKIIDFGGATIFNNTQMLSALVGTAYYIAPEVIRGQYNQKCDIWSCGVILYVMLAGAPPFNGKNQKQILKNIQFKQLQFKQPIWSKRSSQSVELVKLMLNKNFRNRISAIEALNSEWIVHTPSNESKQIDGQIVQNLKTFHFKNKLKAVVYTYIAGQLYSNKDKQTLLKNFREIDKDGDGVLQKQQLFNIFNSNSQSNLNEQQLQNIVNLIDTNGSGLIDYTQFLVAASKESQLLERKRLENAFEYLDSNHSGYLSVQEVKIFLDGSQETSQQIHRIFKQVDKNNDGIISKKQFLDLLLKNT